MLSGLSELYDAYVDTFRNPDGTLPAMMQLKRVHTALVVKNAELIADGEGFTPEEREVSLAAALLHDTGRYEQLRRYNTFQDSKSVDHAVFSHDIVKEKGWLESGEAVASPLHRDVILKAVLYHNRRELPPEIERSDDPDSRTVLGAAAHTVRDADKLDIFRVLEDQVAHTDWKSDSRAFWNLSVSAPPNPVVVDCIASGRPVDYQHIQSLSDFVLIQIGWMISGLHFATSRRLCRERGHLAFRRDFLHQLTDSPDVDRLCDLAESAGEIDKTCRGGGKRLVKGALAGLLMLVGAAASAYQPTAPFVDRAAQCQKTKVLFFFDTEDFTCDESNDAIRDIANILKDEGVRGNFAMIGYLGKFLQEKGRQDVIDALRHHLVGSQTLYHSKHPNIVEYGDVEDYATAYRRTMAEEKLGFEMLETALGMPCRWCSVFPGNANSYVGLYVHAQLGSRIFGGGNGSFTPGERQAAWYVNQFHLPYYKKLHLESFIPPAKPLDLAKALNALSTNDIVTLYMHPHMALSKQHWDGPNFDPRHPVEWGKWLPTPKRDKRDVAVYYDRLRALVHALANDSRFEVTDCEKLQASFRPRKPITKREIPEIRRALLKRLAPVCCPSASWCVADAFQAVVRLLRGEASHVPGFVYGFLDSPRGVTRPVEVSASELRLAAAKIDLDTFIPSEIAVGGRTIGPADFLLAALEALETGAEKVSVVPRDQLGPIGELMPSLATYSMKGGWPLYEDTFEDKYMTARLRLQLWTLRYENIHHSNF